MRQLSHRALVGGLLCLVPPGVPEAVAAGTPIAPTTSTPPASAGNAADPATATAAAAAAAAEQVTVTAPASATAPTLAPLDETEPTSVVNGAAIAALLPPTANYDDAVRLSPSVLDVSPDGPGLAEAATLTIRGFGDGQYNVLFDGIPFADSDDFTHHSSAYFVARDLGSVTVDRGPGDAATIGNATFGGTVALASRPFDAAGSISPDATVGSHATLFGGILLQSGSGALPGGASSLLDLEGDESHGALRGGAQRRRTAFGKLLVPIGADTTLTLLANVSRTIQGEPLGATRAEITANGPSFGLNDDPASQAYEGYNVSQYRTDLSDAEIRHRFPSGATIDDTLYSYGLYRDLDSGFDPNGETPNGTAYAAADVPGQSGQNGLRAWGDLLRATVPLTAGLTLETGAWVERQTNSRFLLDTDQSAGDVANPVLPPVAGVPGSAAIVRLQRETLLTAQPYAQLGWRPIAALTITAGLKGAWSDRDVDAPVMESTRLPTHVARDVGAPLPSLTARVALAHDWSAYAQAARGFLAPPLQFFDVTDPAHAAIPPETTWNFQAGTVWRTPALQLAADAYEILFANAVGSRTTGGETTDFDEGSVTYRGLELEATRTLAWGFSATGSASANSARVHGTGGVASGPAPDTPQATLGGGLLFRRGAVDAALLDQWTGGAFGDVGGTQWVDPFNALDLSAGWTVRPPATPPIRLRAQVFNLLDRRRIDGFAGYTVADATPLWWTQAGLTVFVRASAKF